MRDVRGVDMDANILKPVYEFGALIKYCEENHMIKENLIVHTGMPDLSGIYYKLLHNLSGRNLEIFEHEVQMAYERLIIMMDSKIMK